eukprot:TRINITY_DN3671_c0_g3_i3.p1 TRINITY_DN3671_c0_g3~~TRINITY_DN3671_c0_g3_i3.p1  ORF type:complete len:779 (+),score=181.45 TRINITY_DN3671_c0_g3_i3:479-2815(+)
MRAVPFHLQGKGVLDLGVEAEISAGRAGKRKREGSCVSTEPTSVLERRRSPSPPTSTSTLSASLGGGSSGSTDSAGVAAVSGNPTLHKWPPTQEGCSAADAGRKEEWASELQPIPMGSAGERCSGAGGAGGGMDELESMLTESAASPGNEQSFSRWFMGDMDDPSLKQLLQSGGSSEFESGGNGFGVVDSGLGYGGGVSSPENVDASPMNPPPLLAAASAGSDFGLSCNNISNRLLVSSPNHPSLHLPSLKGSCFGSSSNSNSNPSNPILSAAGNNHLSLPISLPQGGFYQQMEAIDEKPQLFNPQLVLNQQQVQSVQNPALLLPFPYIQQEQQLLPPQPKRHHPTAIFNPSCQFTKTPFADFGQEMFLQQQLPQSISNEHPIPNHLQQRPPQMVKSKVAVGAGDNANHQQQQQQTFVDLLFKAAEVVQAGNSIIAQEILARLNHQLSPVGKPLQRAAFYFKEALQLLLNTTNYPLASSASPLDVFFKISAYKIFSEISPFLQFVNFTTNQAFLEALEGCDRIHIVDFDIGIGGQWASFMQELAMRLGGTPTLKITAFASASSHHPLELSLTQENLTHFANGLNISFQFNVINIDAIDTSTIMSLGASAILNLSDNEAIAVNFPVGSSNLPIPLLLRVVKQVSPKIVVSVDHGCVRSDFPFPQHFLHALQSYSVLFDSLDAVNVNSDAVHKIERYLLQPRIESVVLGRHQAGEKMLPWRALFNSAGFSPLPFSNFTETQGEYMVRRLQGRGFHVEKRHASLYLFWQSGELCSVSAWRC